ncbi:uncharacterized protein UTRI_05417_B [Ustilago trichophora]|uniref:Uncharacterized protein n=1 Tax=Ustilago trichophora TaxID=86804 RepID=A0A5C3EKA7_9BASI|nr:uncharacterized protein UTRI_05417_B [Ustilago trichophora]
MPLLMSRKQSPEAESSAAPSFRSRSSAASSHRTGHSSSQKAAELRARYEMAQAIQKPWPLHLLENGVKPSSSTANPNNTSTSSSRSTRSSTSAKHATSASRSSSRRESRASSTAATGVDLPNLDIDASRSSKKNRNSSNSLDKLSLSPTLVSNWIRRASKDSDKSGRSSSPTLSSTGTSPINSPKDL